MMPIFDEYLFYTSGRPVPPSDHLLFYSLLASPLSPPPPVIDHEGILPLVTPLSALQSKACYCPSDL